jgi:transcriptional antiterminator RfaH
MHDARASFPVMEQGQDAAISTLAWFCLRTQPKHEHIAAGYLEQFEDVEVFNPRIEYTRSTRLGPALVRESMFPNYLFARFDWKHSLAKVRYANGVRGVVHFGDRWPTLPNSVITDLRALVGVTGLHVLPSALAPGDKVALSGGVFHGLEAVITQVMPASSRVVVLMTFLGDQRFVELEATKVVKDLYAQ